MYSILGTGVCLREECRENVVIKDAPGKIIWMDSQELHSLDW